MKKLFQFNRTYFLFTIVLFFVEVFIAKYVDDTIIRPYGGDYLVVILIYCFIKSFYNSAIGITAIAVLIFSFIIETLQYFDFVDRIGLGHYKIARIVMGTSFAWTDILAYILGIITMLMLEYSIGAKIRSAKRKAVK